MCIVITYFIFIVIGICPFCTAEKCSGEDSCCTSSKKCGVDEGDCDWNSDCQDGLVCGIDNCPDKPSFDNTDDCCKPGTQVHLHLILFRVSACLRN